MSQASTAATTGVLLVLRVQLAVTALVVHPVVHILQQRVLQGPMQVERQHVICVVPEHTMLKIKMEEHVQFAVVANIPPPPEEPPIETNARAARVTLERWQGWRDI